MLWLDLVHMLRSLNMCFCSVNTSCKEGRQCHEDELTQITLTLGVVIPSGSVVLLTPVCTRATKSCPEIIVCRLTEQKSCSWRASEMNRERRSCTKKCKGPNTKTVFLLKLKFESLKYLNLLSQPLKYEPNKRKCILILLSLYSRKRAGKVHV